MNLDPRLLQWARQARLPLAATVLCGAAGGALIVWCARLLAQIIIGVFLLGMDLTSVAPVLGLFLAGTGLRVLSGFGAEAAANEAALQVKSHLRAAFARHLVRLGPGGLQGGHTAELTTAAVQGIETLDAYFSQYLPQVALAGMIPLILLTAVLPRDPLSALILALTAPLIPLFMILIGKASQAVTRRQWEALSRLSATFLDSVQGLRELKQLGLSRQRGSEIDAAAERHRAVTMRVLRVTFLSALTLELVGTLSTAVIAVQIGLRLLYGRMGFEDAFFILLIAPEFYQPLRLLGQRFHAAMTGITAARQIFAVLDLPAPQIQTGAGVHVDLREPFEIRFSEVRYTYPGQEQHALNGLTFSIRAGEKVALVGPSGGGKSTVAGLMLRFFLPDRGEIMINGIPLAQVDLQSWRRQVAWVPQRPFLLRDSLAGNISPLEATRREGDVLEAVRLAQLDPVVAGLPQGIDSPIGERGARLSGGEAQRLALARAFFTNAELIVLDEPTAFLDPLNEAILEKSMWELLRGKTALIIAHRLTTVMNADRILVIDAGRVVEKGAHAELVARKGSYFELVQAFLGRQ